MNSKTLTLCALSIFTFGPTLAQETEFDSAAEEIGPFLLSPPELDELLGPVALHPDALVALALPAATAPEDIVLAARYLERGEDTDLIDDQSWDESVKALAHYPELITWLNENLEWTIQIGDAFMAQPADVMQSIQRLRSLALDAGTLTNTAQQYVVEEKEVVRIVPANPTVIYVPYYDPAVVYVRRPYYSSARRSIFTFSIGFRVGSWLTYDCDWVGNRVWYVQNRRYWNTYRDWRNPRFPGFYGYVAHPNRRPWSPPARHYRRNDRDYNRPRTDFVHRRPNNTAPRPNNVDRRPDNRNDRTNDRVSNPNNNRGNDRTNPRVVNPNSDRRDDPRNRTRTGNSNRTRDVANVAPRVPEPRPNVQKPATKVVSPRQNIVNILRERSRKTTSPARQPSSTRTRQQTQERRVATVPRAERPSPRVVSPRERVVNVLRSQSRPTQTRATPTQSNRPSQRQTTARTERQAPIVIHGRTISRNNSPSSGQSRNSNQEDQGRRGRGR